MTVTACSWPRPPAERWPPGSPPAGSPGRSPASASPDSTDRTKTLDGAAVRSRRLRGTRPPRLAVAAEQGGLPMSQIDASDFSSLKDAVERSSNEELVGAIQQQEGGVAGVLDQVFAGMSESFNPDKAAGQQAVVQYEISAPD